MECKECFGSGYYDVGPSCDKPASMCCGGCYKTVECETCNGTGEIDMDVPVLKEIHEMWQKTDDKEFNRWFATNINRLSKELMDKFKEVYLSGFDEEAPFDSLKEYIDGE